MKAQAVDVYIGDLIREIREEIGLSQLGFSEAISGFSQPTICRIEKNELPTPLSIVKEIKKKFNRPEIVDSWLSVVYQMAQAE